MARTTASLICWLCNRVVTKSHTFSPHWQLFGPKTSRSVLEHRAQSLFHVSVYIQYLLHHLQNKTKQTTTVKKKNCALPPSLHFLSPTALTSYFLWPYLVYAVHPASVGRSQHTSKSNTWLLHGPFSFCSTNTQLWLKGLSAAL